MLWWAGCLYTLIFSTTTPCAQSLSPYAWSPSFVGAPGWHQCLDLWQCQKNGFNEDNADAAEKTEQKAASTEEEDDLGGGIHICGNVYV